MKTGDASSRPSKNGFFPYHAFTGMTFCGGMNGLKEACRSYLRVTDMYSISCFPERYLLDRFHIEEMSLWHIRLVPILAYERRSISNLPSGGASVCSSTISPKPIFFCKRVQLTAYEDCCMRTHGQKNCTVNALSWNWRFCGRKSGANFLSPRK